MSVASMRVSFWPERAWAYLMGPAWPWIAADGPAEFRARVQPAIEPYWTSRLATTSGLLLSERARDLVLRARGTITPETLAGAGFEKVEAALDRTPEAFWFFELGSAAWMLLLRRLREQGWLPEEPPTVDLVGLETVWRQFGPGHAVPALDAILSAEPFGHPAVALYRASLALWHDRDPQAGMRALDRAVSKLSVAAVEAMGPTLPLTYALLHALAGDPQRAADLLAEGYRPGRPRGWSGLGSPEVRYHRARYLWDLRATDEALALVRQVISVDASYALRLVTDPAWMDTGLPNAQALVMGAIGDVLARMRSAVTRFQQTRTAAEAEIPEIRRIVDALDFAGDEGYFVLAAGTQLRVVDEYRQSQIAIGPAFYADVERIQQVAQGLPGACTLCVGPAFRRRFAGTPTAEVTRLEHLLDQGLFAEASDLVAVLLADLPQAMRLATINYAQRLVVALATAADVLRERRRREDEPHFLQLAKLAERGLAQVKPIRQLPDEAGPALLYAVQKIWEELLAVQDAWVKYEAKHFGALRLKAPAAIRPIARGGWTAFALQVMDAAGLPVAGVPIVWRVVSGPATPREPIEALEGEWALSLQTGVAYLAVDAKGAGSGGEIEAMVLGGQHPLRFTYTVESPDEGIPAPR